MYRINRSWISPSASSLAVLIFLSGSLAAYINGNSRYHEIRGCNHNHTTSEFGSDLESETISQDDHYPESPGPVPVAALNSEGGAYLDNSYHTKPVVLGYENVGNRFGGIMYGNSKGYGDDDRIANKVTQLHKSVQAYRNQITGNRYFEQDGSVRFLLYTRKSPSVGQKIQPSYTRDFLNDTDFSADKPTKVIVHGFSEIGVLGEWVTNIRDAYLQTDDVNVIVADFSTFQTFLLFWTNLPIFAAKKIADVVTFLEVTSGAKRENFHIIARSYGTHVAGVTGRVLEGRVGRITGLEPEPKVYGTVIPDYRLVFTDAKFVDIVRVNGRRYFFHGARFGLVPPTGHVDIYPNHSERNVLNRCPGFGARDFGFCQKGRGVTYFTDSIRNPEAHPICKCRSYYEYVSGSCFCTRGNSHFCLGEHMSNQTRGVFEMARVASTVAYDGGLLRSMRLLG